MHLYYAIFALFLFHVPATTEIYTLSLHDALPICGVAPFGLWRALRAVVILAVGQSRVNQRFGNPPRSPLDRKSTRLNSSHLGISYAVFCLKKKRTNNVVVGL